MTDKLGQNQETNDMTFRDCNGELSSYKFLRMCVVTTTTQPTGLYKRINHTSLSQLPTAIHSYDHTDWYVYVFIFLHSSTGQGRIYIGASGSMAPGPEMSGGPFENKKIWETYFIKLKGAPGTDWVYGH